MSQTYEPARGAAGRRRTPPDAGAGERDAPARPGGAAASSGAAPTGLDPVPGLPLQANDTGALRPVRPGSPTGSPTGGPTGSPTGGPTEETFLDLLTDPASGARAAELLLVGAGVVDTAGVHDDPAAPPQRSDPPGRRAARAHRDPAVQANAGPPPDGQGRDERLARRGRAGAGPAAGRLTGSKIGPADGPGDGGRGGRARYTGNRRYALPEGQDEPLDPQGPRTGATALPGTGALPQPHGGPAHGNQAHTGQVPAWLVEAEPPQERGGFAAALDGAAEGFTDTSTTMLRPYVEDEPSADAGAAPSLVRPYSRTGGRTKPGHELDLEALVVTTVNGREAWSSPLLSPEHAQVIGLCVDTTSVAEIAARLTVPIGVARVIIADMVDLGLVEVMKTSANFGDERDPAFLRRVLSGLQRL